MTVSLDGYLDPQRLSFGSPNDMHQRISSPDDTFPVFSPPPFEVMSPVINHNFSIKHFHSLLQKDGQQTSVGITTNTVYMSQTTTTQTRQHRRQSSLNTVSWPHQNELVSPRRLSNNLQPTEVFLHSYKKIF